MEKNRCDRLAFLEMLGNLKPGLASAEIVAETDRFIFMDKDVGTYNESLCVTTPFSAGFVGSVKAKVLYDMISKMSGSELQIQKKKSQLLVSDGGTNFGLSCISDSFLFDIIKKLNLRKISWSALPNDEFTRGLSLCCFAAGDYGSLSGVFVKDNLMMSSDNNRGCIFECSGVSFPAFLLPVSSANALINYAPTEYCMSSDDNWIHFRNKNGIIFSSRLLSASEWLDRSFADNFPDVGKKKPIVMPKGELQSAIGRAGVLLSEETDPINRFVELTFSKDGIRCSIKKSDSWFDELIPFDGWKKKGSLSIHIRLLFLHEILDRSTDMYIISDRLVLFVSDNFKHIIALEAV